MWDQPDLVKYTIDLMSLLLNNLEHLIFSNIFRHINVYIIIIIIVPNYYLLLLLSYI